MVFGADNSKGKVFYGNTLREAQEKAANSEKLFINEKFTPTNIPVAVQSVPQPAKKGKTYEELFQLTKKQQEDMLHGLGVKTKDIGKTEDQRIKQILERQ